MKRNISIFLPILAVFSLAAWLYFNSPAGDHTRLTDHDTLVESPDRASTLETGSHSTGSNIDYGHLPMVFEPNVGQAPDSVNYVARGRGYSVAISPTNVLLGLKAKKGSSKPVSTVGMRLVGASADAVLEAASETGSRTNYLIGNDPGGWKTDVANYRRVKAAAVYPGIDAVYYGNGERLEYDFVVSPGADPENIRIAFEGTERVSVDRSGDLMLQTKGGSIRQLKPIVYQEINGERREIASRYELSRNTVSFKIGEYDRSHELTIDPVLAYGSYLGGLAFDEGRSIAVDAAGAAYVVGTAASLDFPTTPGSLKPALLPRSDAPSQYLYDAFVTKIDPSGTGIVYSTYYGGRNGNETGTGVAIDASGNVILAGTTMSSDLPTINAYQTTFGGTDDAFAAKLNASGSSIVYSTYLGGNNTDLGGSVALNPSTGDAVFAGTSSSPNFPTTPGAFKQQLCTTSASCSGIFYSGSYAVKLRPNGSAVYSTLFDAAIADVTLDSADNAVIGGTAGAGFPATPGAFQTVSSGGIEGFIAKLNPSGNSLVYGTFLGGGLQSDRVKAVAVDSAGNIFAAGRTENTGFPTTPGAFDQTLNGGEDAFLTKLNPAGSSLVYSTFFGGTGKDEPFGLGVAADDTAFVAGETTSGSTFPLKNSLNGTNGQIFVTRFNAAGSGLVYSTFLGMGGAYDIAVDPSANAYVTGHTTSVLVTPNSFQPVKGDSSSTSSSKDAFVVKLGSADENAATFSISGVVNDPTQFGDYAPITVTISGSVNRSITLPYGNGSGVIPYTFGSLPAGGNYTVSAKKIGHLSTPTSASFTDLRANQFADFSIIENGAPQAVMTSPTSGTTFQTPSSIEVSATASDPDGDAIASVEFFAYNSNGPSIKIGTDTTAPYSATWTNPPVGTYSIYAVPVDSLGRRGGSDSVTAYVVDVTNPNVTLTSPANGSAYRVGDYVHVDAAVSPSVDLLEYYSGTELIGRRSNASWAIDWRVMDPGNYNVYAKAYLTNGQSFTSNSVNISVSPFNTRIYGRVVDSLNYNPVADVQVRLAGTNNPIAATAITGADGVFSFTDLGATFEDGFTLTPVSSAYTFEPPVITINYVGYVDWEELFVAKPVTGITASLTSPTDGQTYNAPATVHFGADASTTNGSITKVEFLRRGAGGALTVLSTDTTAPYAVDWTDVGVGDYFVLARVTDSTGSVAQTQTVRVTVGSQPTTVRLQGEIHDPAGAPMSGISVDLTGTANGAAINQTTVSSGGSYGFFNLPSGGTYTITPRGTAGMTFTPPSITVNNAVADDFDLNFVSSAANQAPTVQINSPADGSVYSMPASIPFNVTASDPDGQIVHLTVSANSSTQGFTIGQSNNGIFNAPWQPSRPGEYTVYAQARDNGGLVTTTSIHITVNQPAPVAISGRIVDRTSTGIEGAQLELRDYADQTRVIATVPTDATGNFTIPDVPTFASYILVPTKDSYTFTPAARVYANITADRTDGDYTATLQVQTADFDGNGSTDFAVYRPSTGAWDVMQNRIRVKRAAQPFGRAQIGDIPVPANYDGDRRIDHAIFRDGQWLIKNSSDSAIRTVTFGEAGDIPVPSDFDGDGRADLAVWKDGRWKIIPSLLGVMQVRQWGQAGDVPLSADYDGDGITDLCVWRPSEAQFYISRSSDAATVLIPLGMPGDKALSGDFDGDKKADPSIYTPATGTWTIKLSTTGDTRTLQWGQTNDRVVPGDYDLDGKTDLAFFRDSTREWYVYRSSTSSYVVATFGRSGDIPIASLTVR